MDLNNQRRSTNIEDRRGSAGPGGGGLGGFRLGGGRLGIGGLIIIGILLLIMPANLRNSLLGSLTDGTGGAPATQGTQGCAEGDQVCTFLSQVLGSTEDSWARHFQAGALPRYSGGQAPSTYQQPRLVLFSGSVATACGNAGSDVGPFYCPGDNQLYIDPTFYDTMARRLNAPGDFAQAYVIAHEVGHHIQNLIGATRFVDQARGSRTENQMSVRLELQADCFAGVWGHDANRGGQLSDGDLQEALNAAHQIGDDTLQRNSRGYPDPDSFTHGTSEQRARWFRRGFETGDARQCDTFGVSDFRQL
ncbi:MAG: neutral zinc metallopeptidase [Hyphomonadaceae bacterium]